MEVPKTAAVLLLVASALAGCSAQDVSSFSLELVNCQSLGIVSVTDNSDNKGTVCGTVDKATADHICSSLSYGHAIAYGTAKDKGVSGGTGIIEATDLKCPSTVDCTYDPDTSGCTHSQDLVLQCSLQPSICLYIPIGAIIGLVVAGVFFCIILPVIACIGCCVCACLGVACFSRKSPNYNQL